MNEGPSPLSLPPWCWRWHHFWSFCLAFETAFNWKKAIWGCSLIGTVTLQVKTVNVWELACVKNQKKQCFVCFFNLMPSFGMQEAVGFFENFMFCFSRNKCFTGVGELLLFPAEVHFRPMWLPAGVFNWKRLALIKLQKHSIGKVSTWHETRQLCFT